MLEPSLQIRNQLYPFDPRFIGERVAVEERQGFSVLADLLEKRGEVQKKMKLAESHYLIKLLRISQEDLTLRFIYQYVPYPLSNYLAINPNKKAFEPRSFLKKLAYELTMLISCLAKSRIELDLALPNLGLTEEEKLKVYMSSRCRMGHKTEIALIAHYGSCKEKILALLESQLAKGEQRPVDTPNFVIKGNKLVFPSRQLNESIEDNGCDRGQSINDSAFSSSIFDSNIMSGPNISTASCINPNTHDPSPLRQTQSPRFGRNFNFSEARDHKSANKAHKSHKNSFQFGAKKGKPQKYYTELEDDNSDAKSFTHSRSIRIQFQQKFDPTQKRKRKDSCKVKITTFHEYEMEDVNPQEIFGKGAKEQDIFEHFAKREREERRKEQESTYSSDLFSKKQTPENIPTTSASSTRNNLEEKVRLAKEKAEHLLSRFLHAKKTTK